MSETWRSISDIKQISDNQISARAAAPADSPWFSGHFPGNPILPGIAQLAIAFDVIKVFYYNKNLRIESVKKVRFKSLVKPEEMLDIMVTKVDNFSNAYSFKISTENNIACSGIINIKETD